MTAPDWTMPRLIDVAFIVFQMSPLNKVLVGFLHDGLQYLEDYGASDLSFCAARFPRVD